MRGPKALGLEYQKTLDRLDAAERKLTRAFNAWQKERHRLRALGRALDKLQAELDQDERDGIA